MKLVGLNTQCKNNCIQEAFKKSGYRLRSKPVSWPRMKGPAAIRVEVATGYAVAFLKDGGEVVGDPRLTVTKAAVLQ